jgi:hypothetical protein
MSGPLPPFALYVSVEAATLSGRPTEDRGIVVVRAALSGFLLFLAAA